MKKIGIFGGTFDPIHIGHLTILRHFIQKCALNHCYVVPNKVSPFKQNKVNMLSDVARMALIEEKMQDIPNVTVSLYEIEKAEVSYSIDTVLHFKMLHPNDELFLLIGFDVALDFSKWKEYEKILDLVQIVIATRPEPPTALEKQQVDDIFVGRKVIWLDNPIVDITGTQIRGEM